MKSIDFRKYAPFFLTNNSNVHFDKEEYDINVLKNTFNISQNLNSIEVVSYAKNEGLEYLIIPKKENPRWLVPNKKNIIKNIGNLIKPTSWKSKTIWSITRLLNRLGLAKCIFRDSLFIKSESAGKRYLHTGTNSVFVIYTGTKGYFQKFTFQEMIANKVISFTKIGSNEYSSARLKAEAESLTLLNTWNVSFAHPLLLDFYEENKFTFLKQSPCLDTYSKIVLEFTSKHQKVLEELNKHRVLKNKKNYFCSTEEHIETIDVKDDFGQKTKGYVNELKNNIIKTSSSIECFSLTFSHGDFSPWNCFSNGKDLFVFDWEMGDFRMPLWDYFNYVYHKDLLIDHGKGNPDKTFASNKNWAKQLSGNNYDLYHKVYLMEILIHYLEQYSIRKEEGMLHNIPELLEYFTKKSSQYL